MTTPAQMPELARAVEEAFRNSPLMVAERKAAEGDEEAKEYLRKYNARQRDYWSPMAAPTDRFGRVKTTGSW